MIEDLLPLSLEAVTSCLQAHCERESDFAPLEDPAAFKHCRSNAVAVCVALTIYHRLAADFPLREARSSVEAIEVLIDLTGQEGLFSSLIGTTRDQGREFDRLHAEMESGPTDELDPAALYESLLAYEFYMQETEVLAQRSKGSRNRLGTYYTPQPLADRCARLAIDRYLYQKLGEASFSWGADALRRNAADEVWVLLQNSRIADFSCGSGRFFLAYFRYIRRFVVSALDKKQAEAANWARFASNLGGFDVDPLALEIARAEITREIGCWEVYSALDDQFIHGNPLLTQLPLQAGLSTVPAEKRFELSKQGYVFHPQLSAPESAVWSQWDIVLGNPPWEKIRLEERSFFRALAPEVSELTRKHDRKKAIAKLEKTNPGLHRYYCDFRDNIEASRAQIADDPRFSLTATGELNTYALFTELALRSIDPEHGCSGLLVKSSLCTTTVYREFFDHLTAERRLVAFYDFINRKRIFDIDSRERFAFIVAGRREKSRVCFAMGLTEVDGLREDNLTCIEPRVIQALDPVSGMLPNVSNPSDVQLLASLAAGNISFDTAYPQANFGRIVHFTRDSEYLRKESAPGYLPVYEGKFIEQYDGRFATFEGVSDDKRYTGKASARRLTAQEKKQSSCKPEARFFIDEERWEKLTKRYQERWSLMWRNTTSASNSRTTVATILPHMPTVQSIQLLQLPEERPSKLALLLALMNSVVFDYMVRERLTGIDLTQSVLRQIPVPPQRRWDASIVVGGRSGTLREHVLNSVCRLLSDDQRLGPFCHEVSGGKSATPPATGEERDRHRLLLDLLSARAYCLDLSTFDYIYEKVTGETLNIDDKLASILQEPLNAQVAE